MKILVLTDLHDRNIAPVTGMKGIDLVLMLGDITTGGSVDKTREVIDALRNSYPAVYAVPGNWERQDSIRWLSEQGVNLNGKLVEHHGIGLFGIGGSLPTPFNTPNEMTEDDFGSMLDSCQPTSMDFPLIICSHNPPYGACDKVFPARHVGSKKLRDFIVTFSPALVLSGHIHESHGMENIDSTPVVNPGPAPKHYAIITVSDTISVHLHP